MMPFLVAVFSQKPDDYRKMLEPFYKYTENPNYLEWLPLKEDIEVLREQYDRCDPDEFDTFENYLWDEYKCEYDEAKGEYLYLANPKGKWRFLTDESTQGTNILRLKSSHKLVRQAQIKNINLSEKFPFFKRESDTLSINIELRIPVDALITPYGEWHDRWDSNWMMYPLFTTIPSALDFHWELEYYLKNYSSNYITIVEFE